MRKKKAGRKSQISPQRPGPNFYQKRFKILGVSFSSSSMDELLKEIDRWLANCSKDQLMIVTPNPEFVVEAQKDPIFRETINRAQISLPDGVGIIWARKLVVSGLKKPFLAFKFGLMALKGELAQERISGVDFMIELVKLGRRRGWRFFFLGAGPGVAAQAAAKLLGPPSKRTKGGRDPLLPAASGRRQGSLWVKLFSSDRRPAERARGLLALLDKFTGRASAGKTGVEASIRERKRGLAPNDRLSFGPNWAAFAGDGSPAGDKQTLAAIKKAAQKLGGPIDLLFVAYGMKKQEAWIQRNLPKLPVKLAIGVGGAFDYLAGVVPRAPCRWRQMGLEWLYRLIRQPWRWRRQLNLIHFIRLVLSYNEAKIPADRQ